MYYMVFFIPLSGFSTGMLSDRGEGITEDCVNKIIIGGVAICIVLNHPLMYM